MTTRSIVQFSPQTMHGIIKGWVHCLMSESKGRFPTSIILFNQSINQNLFMTKEINTTNSRYNTETNCLYY